MEDHTFLLNPYLFLIGPLVFGIGLGMIINFQFLGEFVIAVAFMIIGLSLTVLETLHVKDNWKRIKKAFHRNNKKVVKVVK